MTRKYCDHCLNSKHPYSTFSLKAMTKHHKEKHSKCKRINGCYNVQDNWVSDNPLKDLFK